MKRNLRNDLLLPDLIPPSDNSISQTSLILLFLLLFNFIWLPSANAQDQETDITLKRPQWCVTAFGGAYFKDRLRDLLRFQATFPDNTAIAGIALGKEVWHYEDWIGFELEGQAVKHFGTMNHWEFNSLLILRWHPFLWDEYIQTSVAVGDGISYATKVPVIEKDKGSGHAMNYLMYELTFGIPNLPKWALAIRYHHRSSIFGLIHNYKGSSNFLCGGIKYYF